MQKEINEELSLDPSDMIPELTSNTEDVPPTYASLTNESLENDLPDWLKSAPVTDAVESYISEEAAAQPTPALVKATEPQASNTIEDDLPDWLKSSSMPVTETPTPTEEPKDIIDEEISVVSEILEKPIVEHQPKPVKKEKKIVEKPASEDIFANKEVKSVPKKQSEKPQKDISAPLESSSDDLPDWLK